MSKAQEAYSICEDIVNDPEATEYAKAYAQTAIDQQMTGKKLDVQMNYVGSNAPSEYKRRIASWQGVDSAEGFALGYCQICGTRDADDAYHGVDEAASGLVCIGCYDDFGSPDECDDCGTVTYEGDSMVSGPHAGKFFCNSCLMKL